MSLHEIYLRKIYPRIKNIRGAHKLREYFRRKALDALEPYNGVPEGIQELEWDILIILDGCRADIYREVIDPEAGTRVSLGSCSGEFIEQTFSDQDFPDVVCITANPHYSEDIFSDLTGKKPDEVFAALFDTFNTKWDEDKGTVLPESVLEDYKTAEKLFPEKRKILHFMQPHHPFVGSDLPDEGVGVGTGKEVSTVWDSARTGELSVERVRQAYKKNLEYVFSQIEDQDFGDRNVVITADHGNIIGEKGLFAHPCESKSKVLREVPSHRFKQRSENQ